MSKSAIRRHHLERLLNERKNHFHVAETVIGNDPVVNQHRLKLAMKTPARCSCWMCGNPRKYFNRRTLQEIKQLDLMKEFIKELTR